EVIDADTPTRETPAFIAEVARTVGESRLVVDRASVGAVELVDAITRAAPDVEVEFTNMQQYAAACGTFFRGVLDGTLHHFNDPDLDAAVEIAIKRDLGDGAFGWGRKGAAGSVAELVAVTVAGRPWHTLPAPNHRPLARA